MGFHIHAAWLNRLHQANLTSVFDNRYFKKQRTQDISNVPEPYFKKKDSFIISQGKLSAKMEKYSN